MKRLFVVVTMLLLACSLSAQTAPYYVFNGDAQRGYIIQNGAIVSNFATFPLAYPVAVGSTIRLAHRDYQNGAEYTLGGVPTGTSYPGSGGFSQLLDGTTDGVQYNYAVECCGSPNSVIRTNLNWQGATVLFNLPTDGTGIAYNTANNHLYVTLFDGTLREYDLAGNQIRSVNTPAIINGLAYHQSSGELWGYSQNPLVLYRFNSQGVLLGSVPVSGTVGNAFGGEFAIAPAAPAAPDVPTTSEWVLGVMAGLLALMGAVALRLRG